MGYRSYFTLNATDAEGRPMIGTDPTLPDAVCRISEYDFNWWKVDGDTMTSEEMKWYDHQPHLAALSAEFPAYRFTLFCEGEDGAQSYLYALGGQLERCNSVMTFPDRTIW